MTRAAAALAALLVAPCAWAGRPLTVEDAAVMERNDCQVEAWVDRSRDAATGWFVPACNFGFDTEWQAGFARTRAGGDARFSEAYAQAKTLLRHATHAEPWGVGLVIGVTRRPSNEQRRGWDHPYALAAFTQAICGTPMLFHANLGWSRDREARRDATAWGAAIEAEVRDGLALLAEAYGENSRNPFLRAGLRWNALGDRLVLDLSWVARPGGTREERFVSLGVTWQSGALAP
jgi:hypothetical protein